MPPSATRADGRSLPDESPPEPTLSTPSNPTARVLTLLEHLARSTEPSGLSELSRQTGLAKATCLAVLRAGVDSGWVVQDDATRNYSMGPAFLAIAAATQRRFGDWSQAEPILSDLTRVTGGACVVMVPLQDQLVTVASSARLDPLSRFVPVGHRLAFVPPFGASSVIWARHGEVDQWMRRARPAPSAAADREFRRALRIVSRRGWVATTFAGTSRAGRARLARVQRSDSSVEYLQRSRELARNLINAGFIVGEYSSADRFRVASLSAPVHRELPGPHAVLYVDTHGDELSGDQLTVLGDQALAAAAELSLRCPPPALDLH